MQRQPLPPSYDDSKAFGPIQQDPTPPPPSYKELQEEWQKLSQKDKNEYELKLNSLSAGQRKALEEQRERIRSQGYHGGFGDLSIWDWWLISRLPNTLPNIQIPTLNFAPHAIGRVLVPGAYSGGQGHGGGCFHGGCGPDTGSGGGCGDAKECCLIILIIIAIIAAMRTVASAVSYAAKKAAKSIKNLNENKKIGKSVIRLLGTAGGGIGVGIKFAIMGAAIGSAFPIVGTVVGAILGACLGAGFGAAISKHVARLYYWLKNRNTGAVSATNREKYTLSQDRIIKLKEKGINTDQMLSALRKQKNASSEKNKKDYNILLTQIRDYAADPSEPIVIKNRFFVWNCKQAIPQWEIRKVKVQSQVTLKAG